MPICFAFGHCILALPQRLFLFLEKRFGPIKSLIGFAQGRNSFRGKPAERMFLLTGCLHAKWISAGLPAEQVRTSPGHGQGLGCARPPASWPNPGPRRRKLDSTKRSFSTRSTSRPHPPGVGTCRRRSARVPPRRQRRHGRPPFGLRCLRASIRPRKNRSPSSRRHRGLPLAKDGSMTRPAGSNELAWLCLSMAWPC